MSKQIAREVPLVDTAKLRAEVQRLLDDFGNRSARRQIEVKQVQFDQDGHWRVIVKPKSKGLLPVHEYAELLARVEEAIFRGQGVNIVLVPAGE